MKGPETRQGNIARIDRRSFLIGGAAAVLATTGIDALTRIYRPDITNTQELVDPRYVLPEFGDTSLTSGIPVVKEELEKIFSGYRNPIVNDIQFALAEPYARYVQGISVELDPLGYARKTLSAKLTPTGGSQRAEISIAISNTFDAYAPTNYNSRIVEIGAFLSNYLSADPNEAEPRLTRVIAKTEELLEKRGELNWDISGNKRAEARFGDNLGGYLAVSIVDNVPYMVYSHEGFMPVLQAVETSAKLKAASLIAKK